LLAREATKANQHAQAADYYRKSLELDPDPRIAFNLGLALRRLERYDEAIAAYDEAIKMKLDYSPRDGQTIEAAISDLAKSPPAAIASYKALFEGRAGE